MALTDVAIKNLRPKAKAYRVADSGNLCLEVSPTGGKLWRWRYSYLGKPQMLALGKYPAVSLQQARKKRDEARELLESGKNPNRERKAEKLRRIFENENTFEKIARRFHGLKKEGLNEKYWTQCLTRMEQHVFPKIGDLPIAEIGIPEVVQAVEAICDKGTAETAKRMKQLIGQVFRYAAQRGLCTHNPAADLRDILPSKEERHHACVTPDELPALLKAIDSRNDDFTKSAMKLLALTFVRTGELIGARWDEVDWEKEEWRIPKERMKMKRPHTVPLSRQTLVILKDLQQWTGKKEHIFHSPGSKSMHLSNGTVLMGLRRMGYAKRMTGHGFRTLASTILNENNFPSDWIERQLAHEDEDKIRSAYNRAEHMPERRKMMQWWADHLDEAARNTSQRVGPMARLAETKLASRSQ